MALNLKGVEEMARKIEAVADEFPDKVESALYIEAELIATDAKENYVPVDIGTLKNDIRVDTRTGLLGQAKSGADIEVIIHAGGGASRPYALSVHEHPSPHDPPAWQGAEVTFSPDGRGPKYISKPLNKAVSGMAQRIASRLDL